MRQLQRRQLQRRRQPKESLRPVVGTRWQISMLTLVSRMWSPRQLFTEAERRAADAADAAAEQ